MAVADLAPVGDESSPPLGRRLSEEQRRWLADLYQANSAAVFRLCGRMLRSPEDAADASQEVFLIALKSLAPATAGATARSWLLTVARNHCIDVLRRRTRLSRTVDLVGASTDPGPDFETTVADRDLIDTLFKRLSLRERQALWQAAVERRPLADIATGLRLNYMAAAQVLHRARQRASVLAGRVAVLIGLAELGRLGRRAALAEIRLVSALQRRTPSSALTVGPRLLVAALVPLLVVATVQVASAVTGGAPARRASGSAIRAPLVTASATSRSVPSTPSGGQEVPAAAGESATGAVTIVPPGPLGSLEAQVRKATSQLSNPLTTLPTPGQVAPLTAVPLLPPLPTVSPLALPTLPPTPIPVPH